MPAPRSELLRVEEERKVSFAIEPAVNALHSLFLLSQAEKLSGLDTWIVETHARLPEETLARNRLVMQGLYFALMPQRRYRSFQDYLVDLEATPSEALRERVLEKYTSLPCCTEEIEFSGGKDEILASEDSFLTFLRSRFDPEHIDEAVERQSYALLTDPPRMRATIVDHLKQMWDDVLAEEWQRARPLVEESVQAFRQADLDPEEGPALAARITGREDPKWEALFDEHAQVIFVPCIHAGPYLGLYHTADLLWVVFGARLPSGLRTRGSRLGRSDLLIWLSALSDDTRLRILQLIREQGELCAQEIIEQLELSQSTCSRHLRQLSASGLLLERRKEAAKCYSMNTDRIREMLGSLERFLL